VGVVLKNNYLEKREHVPVLSFNVCEESPEQGSCNDLFGLRISGVRQPEAYLLSSGTGWIGFNLKLLSGNCVLFCIFFLTK